MTWPFENDTSAITKKLAKKSLQSEKRRNLMVVIAVALAAFLICFTGIVSTSLTQMQRNQVLDTYEAVWRGVEENDIENLKGVPEFERVGGYYMLGEELSEQGYHASYVYCDTQMMEITKAQMELLEGRVPEKANEIVVSKYFLSTYGNNAKIGDTVTLDTESFHGDYVVTGIMNSVNEKEANTCAIILSKAALTEWNGFDPAGYRAYAHFKNSDQLGEELMTSYCREIAEEYQLPMPKMNSKYFAYASKSFDFALMAGVIALVLIGGYIVIQSIFRISINDKIQSYGQLRTIGATPKQIKRIVKNEGRKLGSIGILIGTVLGVCGGFLLFSKGFNAVSYPRFLLGTDLSHTAKLLYTLLLDRATLSQKNNWMDERGFVYVIFPLSALSKALRCSTMSIKRALRSLEDTVMSNHHLRNRALSLKAKGLLSKMLSLPEDWDYTLQGLARINRESIDAIRQAIRELEQAGYIQRSRERDEKGRLRGADYVIFELPQPVPVSVSPTLEKPTLENPMQLNKDKL